MKASELRIGNWINAYHNDVQVTSINSEPDHLSLQISTTPTLVGSTHGGMYFPIPLNEEWLIKFGFEVIEHLVTGPNYQMPIGRDRFISVSGLGGGNEFVFLSDERGGTVNDVVVLRNFDYDGRTYVHHMQNIFHALTGEELTIKE